MPLWCLKLLSRISAQLRKCDFGLPNTISEWAKLIVESFLEAFGTFVIVFFGCGSVTADNDVIKISLSFGLAVFVGIHLTSGISGGFLNPALTLAYVLMGQLSLLKTLFFVIFQCIGAIFAAGILFHINSGNTSLGVNQILTNVTCEESFENLTSNCDFQVLPSQALAIELITTFVFAMVVFSVIDPDAEQFWSPSLMIGLTASLCHLVAIPFTGCSINPARTLGKAFSEAERSERSDYNFTNGPD